MITGFGCYLKYLAIKSHFLNEKYDYFQYNGRVKADYKSYLKRRDKLLFEKLARTVKTETEAESFFVSNFLLDSHAWVGDTLNESSKDVYLKWLKRIESVSYLYKQDLREIKETGEVYNVLYECVGGQHPRLLKMYLQKKILLETLVVLDRFLHIFQKWNEEIKEKIIWPEVYKKCQKYKPFMETYIDDAKIRHLKVVTKQILVD